MEKELVHQIFSVVLLILFFALGFLTSQYFSKPSWKCPVCSFDGGDIVPIVNDQYSDVVLNEINSASSNIDIIMYEMRLYNTNNSVKRMEDALITASQKGVKVKI